MKRSDRQGAFATNRSTAPSADTMVARSTESAKSANRNRRQTRPLTRRVLQLVRRGHLYLGLFLLPWALLYGVTGFLFNHPAAFSDSPIVYFDSQDLVGTELEKPPPLDEFAESLIDLLNVYNKTGAEWTVGEAPVRYSGRDTFVATVDSGARSFTFVLDPRTQSGFIRDDTTTRSTGADAPFATSVLTEQDESNRPGNEAAPATLGGLGDLESIVECIGRSASIVLERKGLPGGVATVTRAPDINFPVMVADGEWTASYNPVSRQVSGVRGEPAAELSWRRFLLRMHLSHRYPNTWNTKWLWALGVDAIALTLCFWGLSGLLMWWQIKATRRAGAAVLVVSLIAAIFLGLNMYNALTT